MPNISEIFSTPSITNSTPEYTNAASGAEIMGKEDFLTLLVAQLQNQDPMNPDDPTEFTAQLAQFSSLEQLFNLNESMDDMSSSQIQSDQLATLDFIGNEVVYTDSSFSFDGDPVKVGYQLDGPASSVSLYIRDENGADIRTLHPTDLGEGDHLLQWDGLNNEGNAVPAGQYSIILEASSAGENSTIAISPLVQSEVTGVDLNSESGDAILHTLAGAEISISTIHGVYNNDKTSNTTIPTYNDEQSSQAKSSQKTSLESIIEKITSGVTGTSTPTATPAPTTESASTDEKQITLEQLQYFLAG